MVCKECGAYNAEHLTHCRVCAAKLKDTEPAAGQAAQDAGRPTRKFAQAPTWPKQAFEGASAVPETPAEQPEKEQPAASKAEPAPKAAPAAPKAEPAAPKPEPAAPKAAPAAPKAEEAKRFCVNCGKQLIADAPFCAYCGARVDAAAAPKAEPAPAQKVEVAPAEESEAPASRMNAASRRFGKRAEKAPQPPKEDYADLYADDVDDEFDDEYDDNGYEDEEDVTPAKGGKGSTILFWSLIGVLVVLIGGLGWYIVSKNGGFNAVVSNLFGGGAVTTTPPLGEDGTTPDPNATVTVNGMSASIEAATVQGGEGFRITISAPTGSLVHIITEAPLEKDTVEITQGDQIVLEVPKTVFLPYDYSDTESVSVTPQIEVTKPDGSVTPLSVPAVTVPLDRLNLTITEPATLTVEQKADNGAITIAGTVDDHTVEVLVNDTAVPVYEGGQFQTEVVPTVDPENGGEIVVTARKINAVTATQTIVVTPYVVKDMTLTVTSDITKLRAEKDSVTVDGTVTAGATVKVTSTSDKVTCGETIVTANGTFSCPVTISEDGFYELTITGTLEGYNEGTATCIVERAPANSGTFRSNSTNLTSAVYGKMVDGTTTSGNFVFTGKIKEIVSTSPYTIVKVEVPNVGEIMVCNRSLKNTLASDDINKNKQIAGAYAGLYPDTELPYIWGWFIWNK